MDNTVKTSLTLIGNIVLFRACNILLKEAWTLAIEALSWMEMQKLNERLALAKTVKQLGISDPNVIRLAHVLVYETARRQNFIDAFVNEVLKPKTLSEFNLGVQAFLRLYVYQTRTAKNWSKIDVGEAESVTKLARAILGWETLQKVEPVLGALLTQKPAKIFRGLSDEERIGLLTFHSPWFVEYCFKLFGRREAIAMLEANRQPPPTYVRLNTLKMDENKILEKLTEEDIKVEKIEQLRLVYKIVNAKKSLTQTESFQEGLFSIQDKASCLMVEATNPKAGITVLDICAARGAKATHLAQLMQNRGVIYSIDYSQSKMAAWKAEVNRMGAKIAQPIVANACNSLPFAIDADIIVLNPPCTNTGAFGTVPSAKWRLTDHYIDRMAEIQWQMLNSAAENVKHECTLIYATRSLTVEENEMLIERFLKWHTDFSLTEVTPKIGLPGLRGLEKCQRLYPHLHQCSGFFIAKLLKE